jgi:hypothetical protein
LLVLVALQVHQTIVVIVEEIQPLIVFLLLLVVKVVVDSALPRNMVVALEGLAQDVLMEVIVLDLEEMEAALMKVLVVEAQQDIAIMVEMVETLVVLDHQVQEQAVVVVVAVVD